MKRITFTVDLDVEEAVYDAYSKPYDLARAAMTCGDKGHGWELSLALGSDIAVRDLEEL